VDGWASNEIGSVRQLLRSAVCRTVTAEPFCRPWCLTNKQHLCDLGKKEYGDKLNEQSTQTNKTDETKKKKRKKKRKKTEQTKQKDKTKQTIQTKQAKQNKSEKTKQQN
jgi:hypothetical protein